MASSNRRKSSTQTKDLKLRVVTYRRISTNEVNQPYSLDAQATSLRFFIDSQLNYEFVGDYVDQQTGTNNKRPGLERMVADAGESKFDIVLVYRLDRLGRSVVGFMEILHLLGENKVALRSATEPFDTSTPSGKMTAQIISVFSEFEHDVLINRILEGFAEKASRGQWMGGRPPYGYSLNKELKSLTVVESEAAVVRQIFVSYLEGNGCKTVAEKLNSLGYRIRSGRRWDQQAVLRILNGAVYAGYIQHGEDRHEGLHEAIINRDDFEKAAKLRSDRQGSRNLKAITTTTSGYILTGMLKCGACGGAYVGSGAHGSTSEYRYYQCSMQNKRADAEKCSNERIDADKLEEMLIGEVVKTYADTTLFERALALAMSNVPDELNTLQQEGAGVAANIKKTQGALDRYFAAFEDGSLSAKPLRERTETLTVRLEELRLSARRVAEQIDELAGTTSSLADLSRVLTRASNILTSSGNYREKKRCLAGLVASVTIQPGRVVQPVLRVPTIAVTSNPKSKNGHREALLAAVEEIESRRTQGDSAVSTSGTPVRMGSHLVERLMKVRGPLLERAVEASRRVVRGEALLLPAWRRYSGVVWSHLDPGTMSPAQRRRLLVPSGLYGITSANDHVADYRLKMDVNLRPLGNMAHFWRPHLTSALAHQLKSSVVVNLLPKEHESSIDWTALSDVCRVVTLSFVQSNGRGAAGHAAKAVKGVVARALVSDGLAVLDSFHWEGWRAHRTAAGHHIVAPSATM